MHSSLDSDTVGLCRGFLCRFSPACTGAGRREISFPLMSNITQDIKRIIHYLFYPFYGYMDNRFRDIQERDARVSEELSRRLQALEDRFARLESDMAVDAQVMAEAATHFTRLVANPGPVKDVPFSETVGRSRLTAREADCVGREISHHGLAAEAGVWFNPPVVLGYQEGSVAIAAIHERIVEIPFILSETVRLPAGSRVLDVGCSESTIAYSLAVMGCRVTAVDLRQYPLQHPNLEALQVDISQWSPQSSFDVIVCLSVVEHLGLPAYGFQRTVEDLDRVTVERMAGWLRPGGRLLLTVPVGPAGQNDFERVYSIEQVKHLLDGWRILSQRFFVPRTPVWWEEIVPPTDMKWANERHGVALIVAEPLSKA